MAQERPAQHLDPSDQTRDEHAHIESAPQESPLPSRSLSKDLNSDNSKAIALAPMQSPNRQRDSMHPSNYPFTSPLITPTRTLPQRTLFQSVTSSPLAGRGFSTYARDGSSPFGRLPAVVPTDTERDGMPMESERKTTALPTWSFPGSSGEQEEEGAQENLSNDTASTASSTSMWPPDQYSRPPPSDQSAASGSGRKRARESLGVASGLEHASKLRRGASQTPSEGTRPSTRGSSDFGSDVSPDLIALLGGDPREDMRRYTETQKEFEERRERERLDEAFARKLQEELDAEAYNAPASSQSVRGRPSLGNDSYQAYIGSNGRLSRTAPASGNSLTLIGDEGQSSMQHPGLVFGSASGPTAGQQGTTLDTPHITHGRHPPNGYNTGHEQRLPSSFGPRDTTDFIDLASDSESDAEFAEIPSHQFTPRSKPNDLNPSVHFNRGGDPSLMLQGPSAHSGQSPYLSQMSQAAQPSNSHGYGPQANSSRMTGGGLANGLSSAANAVYNAVAPRVLPWMQPQPSSVPSASGRSHNADPMNGGNMFGRPGPFGSGSLRDPYSLLDWEDSQYGYDQDDYFDPGLDPAKTAEELRSLMNNIRPDDELGASDRTGSPEDMAEGCALYEHQKLGLAWMIKMEQSTNQGGILADDMGLGKTIQAIALMTSQRSEDPNCKTTLIVAPVALLKQWENEIKIKLKPGRRLSTYMYHGSKKNITWDKLRRFDVVLTTFGTLASELGRKERVELMKKANPNYIATLPADQLPLLGERSKFYRVILDEAQNIKNKQTRAAKATYAVQATKRFCMTGTPMMNNVGELFSLICFLRIRPYCVWERFNHDFARPLKSRWGDKLEVMRKLQALLKAILLRRTKKSEINGKPILTLPDRILVKDYAVFDDEQLAFYNQLETRSQIQFNRYIKAGSVGKNYANALVLLLRLRQACCHPHLIRDITDSVVGELTPDELEEVAKTLLSPETVKRIMTDGMADCPICMDVMENSTIFTPCGHSTCSECFVRIADSSAAADDIQGPPGAFRCMTCRGNVDPKKVTDWNTFKQVYMGERPGLREEDNESDSGSESDDCGTDSDDESDDESDDGSLKDFIVDDDEADSPIDSADDAKPTMNAKSGRTPKMKAEIAECKNSDSEKDDDDYKSKKSKKSKKVKKSKKAKGKRKEKIKKKQKTLSELQKESCRNAKARHKYMARLKEDWVTSAKVEKCLEVLDNVLSESKDEKIIIFSQFTTMLDLLEVPIIQRDWPYKRYDGSMSSTARNDAVLEFTSRRGCRIMLVSLKAGNSGLNLTAANHVILFDPFWNPYIEEQAIDRAHRIGQRKPVHIHRLLVANTVEDRICELQEKKRAVIEGALDEAAAQNIARLGVRELAFLFGVSSAGSSAARS